MERAKGKEAILSHQREPPNQCPRCYSINTKCCNFNNYSKPKRQHFCRTCCRYWTEGAKLRNVRQGSGYHHRGKCGRAKVAASSSCSKVPATAPSMVPPLLQPPPTPTTFLIGGGDDSGGAGGMPGSGNFHPFDLGNNSALDMMADIMGFRACYDQACFNPTVPKLLGFLDMPNYPQMQPVPPPPPPPTPLPPQFDPSLVMAPHQLMNSTVFTSTAIMTTAVATTVSAAATADIKIDGELGFWNNN